MPPFSAYGMISEPNNPGSTTCHKSRRRISIIVLSTVLLVAIVIVAVLATNHGSSTGPQDPNTTADTSTSLRTSIKAICTATLYPDSCYSALSPAAANSSRLDPAAIFRFSIQATKESILTSANILNDPIVKGALDSFTAASISDCQQLLSLAATHIEDCISTQNFTSESFVDDLKTWLSAAITDQYTCLDGLGDGLGGFKEKITEAMQNSTKFTSNSLAILNQISNFLGSIRLRRRRLMSEDAVWMSAGDRRLLKSTSDLKKTADLVVDKDGSGNYKSISDALTKVPEKSSKRFVIYVKKGVYYENVRVEKNKWNVMIIGDGMDTTVVSGSLNFVDGTPTFSTATFAVFGKNFIATEMGFKNTAGAAKHQAVALLASADCAAFYRCKIDAYQDTLYTHSLRQFYRECNIYGTVDFIFGNSAVVFQACNILPRAPLLGQQDTITAQGKTDPNQNTGISIHNCTVWPAQNLGSTQVYLGRPWKPYSTTVFMRTTMAGIITPAGWLPWNGTGAPVPDTIFYSEYQNFGPGSGSENRVKWKGLRAMDSKQAAKFTVQGHIRGNSWIPKTGIPYFAGF